MPARLVLNETLPDPYTALYQANRFAARSADGTWFYAVQDGTPGRVFWHNPTGWHEIPLDPQPTMRPTLYADPSGLYVIAGFDGDKKHLLVWYIEEYRSVYPATGVPGPAGPQGPQGPQGEPGGGGGLTAEQAQVLDYLVTVVGPLLG